MPYKPAWSEPKVMAISVPCHKRRQLAAALCLVAVVLCLALSPGVPPSRPVKVTLRKSIVDLQRQHRHVGSGFPLQVPSTLVEHFGVQMGNTTHVVHVAAVSCGSNISGVLNLIKSAGLFNNEEFVHFHVFSDASSEGALQSQFSSVSTLLEKRQVAISLHRTVYPVRAHAELWKHTFKPCATARLFLPVLLPNITSLIYMDTDTLFCVPPKDLWAQLGRMDSSHLLAMALETEDPDSGWYNKFARHPFFGEVGVNSGVLLMHLERMREGETNWTSTMEDIFNRYSKVLVYGDQDLLNIYFHFHPGKLQLLACEWNFRSKHCMHSGACKSAEVTGVKVLHGSDGSFLRGEQPEFPAIYEAFNKHTLKDVMENKDLIKHRIFAQLAQDPRVISGPSQCYGNAIQKTILSLIKSF